MKTRRDCLLGLSAFAASAAAAQANVTYEVLTVGPRPKLIRGKPNKVDFGHGLLVPMSADAFHTLWEGDDRWLAFGHGFASFGSGAMVQAVDSAEGTMKLYLLTLAFAPERLMRVDGGGWRLRSGDVDDLLRGDVDLPGHPVKPVIDEISGYTGARGKSKSGRTIHGPDVAHATSCWLVWKKDATIEYVRRHAMLVAN